MTGGVRWSIVVLTVVMLLGCAQMGALSQLTIGLI
jgi:hypothetical protein